MTALTVNWNSLTFLRAMLDATVAMSPPDLRFLVVDNGSTDGSVDYLRDRDGVQLLSLPMNVGHGVALDLGIARISTEYVAVLDVDAFPISEAWLDESINALKNGAQIAGARLHRNFIHPCFLVTRTQLLHQYGLTFRPIGSLAKLEKDAPLFLDVGEALSQRVIIKFRGSQNLHRFEISSLKGPGMACAVFGGLVYHNMYATQGVGQQAALASWNDALAKYHPQLFQTSERG